MTLLDPNCQTPLGAGVLSTLGAETCPRSAMIVYLMHGSANQREEQQLIDSIFFAEMLALIPTTVKLRVIILWLQLPNTPPPDGPAFVGFSPTHMPPIIEFFKTLNDPISGDRYPLSAILDPVNEFAAENGGKLDILVMAIDKHGIGFAWEFTDDTPDEPVATPPMFSGRISPAMAQIALNLGTTIEHIDYSWWEQPRYVPLSPNAPRGGRYMHFGAIALQRILSFFGVPF